MVVDVAKQRKEEKEIKYDKNEDKSQGRVWKNANNFKSMMHDKNTRIKDKNKHKSECNDDEWKVLTEKRDSLNICNLPLSWKL